MVEGFFGLGRTVTETVIIFKCTVKPTECEQINFVHSVNNYYQNFL